MSQTNIGIDLDRQTAVGILSQMKLIRRFEETVQTLFKNAELPGFVHLSIGQESVPAAACAALTKADYITSTHRGHGHCIGKGADISNMIAELFGKRTGTNGGRGGSMHIADTRLGILGANGIVCANLGIAAGAAFRCRNAGNKEVALAFVGDGAVNTGLFHEVMNLSSVWKLPLIAVIENNGWTEMSRSKELTAVPYIVDRAASYAVKAVRISDDVEEVYRTVSAAKTDALAGRGPTLIDCVTTRWFGHYEGDAQAYCSREEIDLLRSQDSHQKFAERCKQLGYITDSEIVTIERNIAELIDSAVTQARNAREPDFNDQTEYNLAYA
jgi:TPP-dependent pyruvate/acetoin dehydrogenase alpha subunit